MMEPTFRLGRLFGIPIGVHWSWFPVFFAVTFTLQLALAQEFPRWPAVERWAVALTSALLFFGSVLAHELAHSLLARWRGIPVRGITLFVFGGVSQIEREASRPGTEFLIAVVGPLASFLLGALCLGSLWLLRPGDLAVGVVLRYLALVNLSVGVFNLLPGFPLDGGRVLRAVLWSLTRSYARATRIAVLTGQAVGMAMMGGGVLTAITARVALVTGAWLALLGWFLYGAASAYSRQFRLREVLAPFRARDLVTPHGPLVPPNLSLQDLVQEWFLGLGQRAFLVGGDFAVVGLITLRDVSRVPRERWPLVTVAEVMVPIHQAVTVHPDENAFTVLERMDRAEVNQVPVVEGGRVLGLITREAIIRFLRMREELGI